MPTCGTSARWSAASGANKKFGNHSLFPECGGFLPSVPGKEKIFRKNEKNACIFVPAVVSYRSRQESGKQNIRVWRSLVSRLNGVQEASSSNLDTRTMKSERTKVLSDFIFHRESDSQSFAAHKRRFPCFFIFSLDSISIVEFIMEALRQERRATPLWKRI